MRNDRFPALKMLLVLLMIVTSAAAQEPLRMRNCRPAALHRDIPALKRAPASGENPFIGDRHQLLVLVAFKDRQFKEADPVKLWSKVFNEKGFSESGFHGSVSDYFYDQSYGQFNITFDVYYIQLADSCSKYRSTQSDDENSKYLVQDVVDSLRLRNIDWTRYEWAGDGYVSQLLMLYAGKGMHDGGGTNSIWPHQYWMTWHGVEPPEVPAGDRTLKVDDYCCVQELTGEGKYGVFGTICHEYSHCFGLPDFYNGKTQYVGKWDIMDYGNYNLNGFCPPGYSAHERMFMGWINPVELKEPADITQLPPLNEQPQAYIIRNDGYTDEYYLIENRQQNGWDESLPGSGILVFHVDYDAKIWKIDMPNSNSHKRYTIFPANNNTRTSAQGGWAYPYLGNDSLTNYSAPQATLLNANSDGEKLMSKPITDMKVEGGLASFKFMGGSSTAIRPPHYSTDNMPPVVLYDLGPLLIVRCADGTIKKVMKH
jgi:M6 family metalloprotease-like protein